MDVSADSNKEYIWCAKLDAKSKVNQWEGRDDGVPEQIVLKRACLGVGAKDNERNIIEVTSFNHKQKKVEVCICSLRSGLKEDESLSDLTILPPAVFKLVAGSGPVHLVGNHMILEDFDEGSDEDDLSDDEMEDLDMEEVDSEQEKDDENERKSILKQQLKKIKQSAQEDDDDDDDDEDDDFDDEEDDEISDEEEEEEEEAKPVQAKKRKMESGKVNGDAPQKKKAVETPKKTSKLTPTPKKKEEAQEKKTPKKKDNAATPKTPLQQKENKTPQSVKNTPKTYSSVTEVISAIKKFPGGKPKKEEKFTNWVKHTFRVTDEEWIKQLWKFHREDIGL